MKKVISLFLVILLLLSLLSCGQSETDVSANDGIHAILSGLSGKWGTDQIATWAYDHVIGGELEPQGLDIADYTYIFFYNLQ